MAFELRSPAFAAHASIPRKFASDGENISPPLEWIDLPSETKSFVLVVQDPDAPSGLFHHWALFNIGGDRRHLEQGFTAGAEGEGIAVSENDFGHRAYDGPKPPKGDAAHHYHFKLAALDTDRTNIPQDVPAAALWQRVAPHIIDEAELIGLYRR